MGLLGLEVPAPPAVSLAGVRADGVALQWKPMEQRSSVEKYIIRVNGIEGQLHTRLCHHTGRFSKAGK